MAWKEQARGLYDTLSHRYCYVASQPLVVGDQPIPLRNANFPLNSDPKKEALNQSDTVVPCRPLQKAKLSGIRWQEI